MHRNSSSFVSPLRFARIALALSAMLLIPLGSTLALPVADSIIVREGTRVIWDFESSNDGWGSANMITGLAASKGCLRGTVNGGDPYMAGPLLSETAFKDTVGVAVRIYMSAAGPLELFWENENGSFAGTRRVVQTVPGQQWTTVRFDLSSNPEWVGKTIRRLRLDPGAVGTIFAIDYVAAVDHFQQPDVNWLTQANNFDTSLDGWTAPSQVSNFLWEEGKLKGKTSGVDPHIVGPTISLTGQTGVMAQFKARAGCPVKLYWTTTEGGFSETRSSSANYTNTGGWQLLKFDLRNHPEWAGKTITQLRLGPGTASANNFEFDSIIMTGAEGFDDADGDLIDGISELAFGTDPAQRSQLKGRLTHERWNDIGFYSTSELVADRKFYSKPDIVRYDHPLASSPFYQVNYFATHARGWITAPVTGTYRFWISGANGVQLLLSEDGTKYSKRKIAELNPEIGTGHGVASISTNLWDNFGSQMSKEIHLTQGSKYYLEAIQSTGHIGNVHVSMAWAKPGQARTPLDLAYIESYAPTADDLDDDYLPDAWEQQYGLNPQDNGFTDLAREGERGDFDGDGLTNREEYLLGTDPTNSDTDGDGETDGNEVNALGSNALVANAITDTLLSEIALGGYVSSSTAWTMTSGGLLADSFRGEATWNFNVPSDGNWLFRLDLELMGSTFGNEEVPVVVKVDGKTVVRRQVRFGSGKFGLLQALTPWLLAGNHQITVLVDNSIARRTVRLTSLKIYAPSNAAAALAQGNRVLSHPASTRTSPAFIEGYARDPGTVTLNGIASQIGTGNGHWFANVPLTNVAAAQPYTLQYEQGWQASGTFTWQATNVMDGETLVIRKGDALRVGAWGEDPTMTSTVTLSSGGTTTLTGQETTTFTFSTAGVFTVSGHLQSGANATLTVKVIAPPGFSATTVDALDNCARTLSVSAAPEVAFDAQEDLCRLLISRTATTASVGIVPAQPVELGVAARLFTGGPILAIQRVNVIGVSDALQNDLTSFASSNISGYKLLQSPLTVLNLPSGARVDVSIFRAGVMFTNGTTLKSIYPADLTNGSVILQFLFPIGQPGGYCHNLLIYDRNGLYLGTR